MSTGQMDNKTYDVIFVARKNAENKNAGMIAENVDKATAIRFAQRYCHRNEDNEGVMIAYHGTTVQPEGSNGGSTRTCCFAERNKDSPESFRAVFVLPCVCCGR